MSIKREDLEKQDYSDVTDGTNLDHHLSPGRFLSDYLLKPYGIKITHLAREIGVQATRISQIIRDERKITLDTAKRFSQYFGMSIEFWLNLQLQHDLEVFEKEHGNEYHIPVNNKIREMSLTYYPPTHSLF